MQPKPKRGRPWGEKSPLTVKQILEWVDDYYKHYGKWPLRNSGKIRNAPETWTAINVALNHGNRGLPGGSSLAQLLAEHRGVRNRMRTPRLTRRLLRQWVREWRGRTGEWPTHDSGAIPGSMGDTWASVAHALLRGRRGLPGGMTLRGFLQEEFGVPNPRNRPRLNVKQILAWADAYHAQTGKWPKRNSGAVADQPGESWSMISNALVIGWRGLPGGSSLAQLLYRQRGARNPKQVPDLTAARILGWARQYVIATGRRPTHLSGRVLDNGRDSGETWGCIHAALYNGSRGLPGDDSLYQLLKRHGLAGNHPNSTVVVKLAGLTRRRNTTAKGKK